MRLNQQSLARSKTSPQFGTALAQEDMSLNPQQKQQLGRAKTSAFGRTQTQEVFTPREGSTPGRLTPRETSTPNRPRAATDKPGIRGGGGGGSVDGNRPRAATDRYGSDAGKGASLGNTFPSGPSGKGGLSGKGGSKSARSLTTRSLSEASLRSDPRGAATEGLTATWQAGQDDYFGGRQAPPEPGTPDARFLRRNAVQQILEVAPGDMSRRSVFGIGDRIDPQKWATLTEKHRYGGHYSHVTLLFGEEAAQLQQERDDHDQSLLAHVCDPRHVEFVPTSVGGKKVPASPASARGNSGTPRSARTSTTPRPPMKTAFTDRSIRLREGRAARSLVCPGGDEPEEKDLGSSWAARNPLGSDLLYPAGQPSHFVLANKESGNDQKAFHGDQSMFVSEGISAVLDEQKIGGPKDELEFRQAMTRKIRRAHSESANPQDPQDADASGGSGAGSYKRRGFLEISSRHFDNDPVYGRGHVSYTLSPKDEDPPHPHDRITNGFKKASGTYRDQMDPHTERLMVHWNQNLYRYDVFASGGSAVRPVQRAASCPPDHAGVPRTENREGTRNPITHEDSGSPVTPRSIRGRAGLGSSLGHRGEAVKRLTNHDNMARDALRDRGNRLATDRKFAELCAMTAECGKRAKADAADIKVTKTRHLSTNVASALCWDT